MLTPEHSRLHDMMTVVAVVMMMINDVVWLYTGKRVNFIFC